MRRTAGSSATIAAAVLGCCLACSVDRHGLGRVPRDGATDARLPDGALPDGALPPGTPCRGFGGRRVIAVLGTDTFRRGPLAGGAAVDSAGQLGLVLQPFRYGAILTRGFATSATTFESIAGAAATGQALRSLNRIDSLSALTGLGLDGSPVFTVASIGEILLPAGAHSFALVGSESARLEVDVNGDTRTSTSTAGASSALALTAPREDWYPLRLLVTTSSAVVILDLRLGLDGAAPTAIAPSRLRVDLSATEGRDLWGFGGSVDTPVTGSRIDLEPSVVDFGLGYPDGIGITWGDFWTARWVGRVQLERGMGTVTADTDDYHRLWVDGMYLGGQYGGLPATASYEMPFPAGYRDVVYELEEIGGSARSSLTADGSAFRARAAVPNTRFGSQPHGKGISADLAVSAGRTALLTVVVSNVPLVRPTAVEVSATVATARPETIRVEASPPRGSPNVFSMDADGRRVGAQDLWIGRRVLAAAEGVESAQGTWQIIVHNDGDDDAKFVSAGILVHIGGDPAPYPSEGTVESEVVDLGDEAIVSGARLLADLPPRTAVDIAVRFGATEDDVTAAEWLRVGGDGSLPAAVGARFAQVRLTLRGPGYDTPRVDEVRLIGRPCLRCDAPACEDARVFDDHLLALYAFDERAGDRVRDMAGYASNLDLRILSPRATAWSAGGLAFESEGVARTDQPATAIIDACRSSGAVTVEAWVEPSTLVQPSPGPARMVTLSRDGSTRNFTLAQADAVYEARLRTSTGDLNGAPFLDVAPATQALTHVVATYDASDPGLVIYLNGTAVGRVDRDGDLSTWDRGYHLAVGNEVLDARAWLGRVYLVALYDRALTAAEVRRNLEAGPHGR